MKKLIVMLALVSGVGVASASELWWTVDQTDEKVQGTDWDTARVYYFNSSDTSLSGQYGTALPGVATKDNLAILDYATSTLSGDLSSYSFYVELYNSETYNSRDDHSDAYRSAAMSYNDLLGSINQGGTSYGASPYQFSSFGSQVVPEPTSGLLVLFGMMALGLKRKKV